MVNRLPIAGTLLTTIVAMSVALALTPQIWLGSGLLTGSDLARGDALSDLRPHRLDTEIPGTRTNEFQQIRAIIDQGSDDERVALFLVDADDLTRIYFNNIQIGSSDDIALPSDRAAIVRLPEGFWQDGHNTLDIIYPTTARSLHPPLAVIAPLDSGLAVIDRYLAVDSATRTLIVAAGLLSALMGFVILTMLPQKAERRWLSALQSLLLTVMAAFSLNTGSPPLFPVSALLIAFALLFVVTIALAYRTVLAEPFAWPKAALLGLQPSAGLCLFIGLAGTIWGADFEIWPSVATAAGLGLALVSFVFACMDRSRIGLHLIGNTFEKARNRERLIRNQRATISKQSETLEAEIHRRAILEERERFSRDIHDGLGGSLLSLLVQVRSGKLGPQEIENALEANLDELRMMVDSMDQSERSLNAALSTFQARIRSVFGSAGIQLNWVQPEIRLPEKASPDFILHLYRILQEAGSNIIRHSNATRAEYRFSWNSQDHQITIAITNDGSKLAEPGPKPSGNGLTNMAQRVAQMQGRFQAGPKPNGGWAIQISLPV